MHQQTEKMCLLLMPLLTHNRPAMTFATPKIAKKGLTKFTQEPMDDVVL